MAATEHGASVVVRDGFRRHVEVAKHCVGFPASKDANDVSVDAA